MANTTGGLGVDPDVRPQPVPTGKPKVKPVPTGKPKVKPVPTGKPKVIPVPTGKPHVYTPVLHCRPNRPFPVPTYRGYTPSPDDSRRWISAPSGIARVPTSSVVFPTGRQLPVGYHKHSTLLLQSSMSALKYTEEHNKVGYLLKPTGSDDYHQIIDFLSASHIRAPELGPPAILATIDKTPYTITEELVRIRLQLADDGGIVDLPSLEIYSGMDNLGYVTKGKITFFKNKFSPQWRGMVSNIGNAKKFLMYPRFLQTILGIETRLTRQFKVLAFSSKLFANMRLNFAWHPMPLLPAMLLQAQVGGGAETAADSLPTREDAPLGGGFHTSPPRSFQAPSACQPSRGKEDPITLTALSSVVSTLMQKVRSLEAELHDHKRLFKDVIGNLCAPTAVLLGASDVPPATFSIPPGAFDAPTGASTDLFGTSTIPAAASAVPADSLNVLVVPVDSPNAPAGMEEDRLGEEAAKRLHAEEMAQIERERVEAQRKRQQEVIDSAMYYNESDWLNIRAQLEANASLCKTLLGDDVSKDNFPARMTALIKKKRQALAEQLFKERQNRPMTPAQQKAYMRQYVKNQSSVIYNTGWTMAYVKSFTDEQLKQEFEKIRKVQSQSQIQAFSRTLKRSGPVLEEPTSKRPKSPEALICF
uniref:JmjC domain-containing protein n=1 Tax=Tanacetum cinerariifolium TaxID=118510 RepID=A0A6L2MQJ6_TANCI|nr:JmjC domain-containing protein [Tanacetum cinerariifolium]